MITREHNTLTGTTGATFSDCERYRYKLWRVWDKSKGICMFLMLNPSTADELQNDPTVERCERRARSMGYGGLVVCNLFAFRATQPADMKAQDDPVGPDNDAVIIEESRGAAMIVCAWGNHGIHRNRSERVRAILGLHNITLHALNISKSGEPAHPLYQPYDRVPVLWPVGAGNA